MAIGSGLAASFGLKAESTFNTYAAPDAFYRINSAEVKPQKGIAESDVLAAGALQNPASYRVVTTTWGSGAAMLPVPNTKFGRILNQIFASGGTPMQQGATAAYLQTHTLGDNVGKFFSAQLGVPNRAGTVVPHTGTGGKVTSAEFSCGVNEQLSCSLEFDFAAVSNSSQTLASPSYTSQIPFHFKDMTVKLGTTFGSEVSVTGIKKVSLKIERPQDVEAFYAGASGVKAEQVTNGYVAITGTIEADYIDKTVLEDLYAADTQTNLVWDFTKSTAIAGSYFPQLQFKVPGIFFDGDAQGVDGPGVQSTSFSFSWRYDGTNMPSALYQSTDTAL